MKTQSPPQVPGTTETERFDSAARKTFNVSKEVCSAARLNGKKMQSKKG
jgi:hypothetical protein